jgi:hypothetical protein
VAGLLGSSTLAGCAATRRIVSGDVSVADAESHIHPPDRPYVDGGVSGRPDPRAWVALYVHEPAETPFTAAGREAGLSLDPADSPRVVVLVVEVRSPARGAARLEPYPTDRAGWNGWNQLRVPLRRRPAEAMPAVSSWSSSSSSSPSSVVTTTLVRCLCRTDPGSAYVTVETADGAPRHAFVADRVTT